MKVCWILRYTKIEDTIGEPWRVKKDDFYITFDKLNEEEKAYHLEFGNSKFNEEVFCHLYKLETEQSEIFKKCYRHGSIPEIILCDKEYILNKYVKFFKNDSEVSLKNICSHKKSTNNCCCFVDFSESFDKEHIWNPDFTDKKDDVIYDY